MAARTGTAHVVTTTRKYKDRVYRTHLLRRSYREEGVVKNETLGNLSHLPDALIELIRRALQGERFVPAAQALEITRSRAHGHVQAVAAAMHRLGLSTVIAAKPSRERDLVLAMVAARVIEHRPEAQLPYEQVKPAIGETLRRRAAAGLAQKDGEAKLAELRMGKDAGLKWSPARVVSRREAQGMTQDALQRAVSADVSKLPAYVGVPFPEGYLLLRISKVIEADAKEADAQTAARIGGLYGRSQYDAYVGSLRERGDIEVIPANLEKK